MRSIPVALGIVVTCLSISLVSAQTPALFEDRVFDDGFGNTLRYRIYLPEGHNQPGRQFPVVTWLHRDGGFFDSRPSTLVSSLQSGPYASILIAPQTTRVFHTCQRADPFLYCAPGINNQMELVFGILEDVESQYSVDTSKRVIMGHSGGGGAAFGAVLSRPGFFSAAVPIQSGYEARRFRDPVETRIWAMHGHDDDFLPPIYSSSTVHAITQNGGSPIYLEPPGDHSSPFLPAFFEDADNELYPWIFDGVEPSLAKLIYDPASGAVVVDATSAPQSTISRFEISAGREDTSAPTISDIQGDPVSLSRRGIVEYTASDGIGFGGMVDLGNILPPGLGFTELHSTLSAFHYDSPAASPEKTFRVVIEHQESLLELSKIVSEEPWISYTVSEAERVVDVGFSPSIRLGGSRQQRLIKKFRLPNLDEGYELDSATLRLFVDDATDEAAQMSLWHAVGDNDYELSATDYFDEAYVATNVSVPTSADDTNNYHDLDVTRLIRADYEADTQTAVSAFRLQFPFVDGSDAPRARVAMPRDRSRFPHLVLSFNYEAADCNDDAVVDANDLSCVTSVKARDVVLSELGSLPGDLNGNGQVALDDFLLLAENYGKQEASYSEGNIDLDQGVGFNDFLLLAINFGKTSQVAVAVPEPDTNAAMIVLLTTLALRRKSNVKERLKLLCPNKRHMGVHTGERITRF